LVLTACPLDFFCVGLRARFREGNLTCICMVYEGLVYMYKFLDVKYCSIFICICYLLFHYILIRFKKFVSQITDKLCN